MVRKLWPASRGWRIVWIVVFAWCVAAVVTFAAGACVTHSTPAHADEPLCPVEPPHGDYSGVSVLYQGACEPLMVATTQEVAPQGARFMNAQVGGGPQSCSWTQVWTLLDQEVASVTVSEPFTVMPFSNLADFPSTPYVNTNITPLGSTLSMSWDSVQSGAYASRDFSPGIHAEVLVGLVAHLNQKSPGGLVDVRQHTVSLNAYITAPTPLYPDPCAGPTTPDWRNSTTDILRQIVGVLCGLVWWC
jgi:hypothetical protein